MQNLLSTSGFVFVVSYEYVYVNDVLHPYASECVHDLLGVQYQSFFHYEGVHAEFAAKSSPFSRQNI